MGEVEVEVEVEVEMQTLNGKIEGDRVIGQDTTLNGMITGSVKVSRGAVFDLTGMVCGSLAIEQGATVNLRGTVCGDVINDGGELFLLGMVQGRVLKQSGSTHVDPKAVITGGIH